MNRTAAICLYICLLLAGMAIPIGIVLYLSWVQAEEAELDRLYRNVKRLVARSRICLDDVYQALDDLEAQRLSCGTQDLAKMHNIVFSKHCIKEIAYVQDGALQCSSEGVVGKNQLPKDTYLLPNGAALALDSKHFAQPKENFISFSRGNYAISVDAAALTDVIVETQIRLGLLDGKGRLISSLNFAKYRPKLMKRVMEDSGLRSTEGRLVSAYSLPGYYYFAHESMKFVFMEWRKSLVLFLPFGILMSLIASGAVLWGLKRRLSPLGELKLAIAHREFIVHYQPIVDFKTEECIGAEALVRWRRPDGTMIRPDLFIPMAEESGLISPLTDLVIATVIEDLKEAFTANRDLHVSINVPVADFNSKRIFKKLSEVLPPSGIETRQIWLEITEQGFMDVKSTKESLDNARQAGYTVVIDDFGTGYSSLSYLRNIPLDVLKIDKSFVSAVDTDSVTSHVTAAIIHMAKQLNLRIVAEGVEKPDQAEYLKKHQVDYAQGWLYAKAMPLGDFLDFCKVKTKTG